MQDSHGARRRLGLRSRAEGTQDITANPGRVDAVVASVECSNQLRKDGPDERLLRALSLDSQIPDDPAEITIAAVLHVEVEVLG